MILSAFPHAKLSLTKSFSKSEETLWVFSNTVFILAVELKPAVLISLIKLFFMIQIVSFLIEFLIFSSISKSFVISFMSSLFFIFLITIRRIVIIFIRINIRRPRSSPIVLFPLIEISIIPIIIVRRLARITT